MNARRAALIVLAAGLTACRDDATAALPDPPKAPPLTAPPRAERVSPATPPNDGAADAAPAPSPAALLDDLAHADRRAAAAAAIQALDAAPRAAVLDAGVHHADPQIARTAATLVHADHASAAVRPRVARLLIDAALDPVFRDATGERIALDAFVPFGDAETLAHFIDRLQGGDVVSSDAECGDLLSLAGSEHVEVADRLAKSAHTGNARIGAEIAAHVRAYADAALRGDAVPLAHPTRADALAALAALPDAACPFVVSAKGEIKPGDLARLTLLETGARDEFLSRVRAWAAAESPPGSAHHLLIELADSGSAPRIAAALATIRETSWASVPWDRASAIRSPEIRAALVAHVTDAGDQFPPSVCEALAGIARQDGLPVPATWWVFGIPRPAIEQVREHILAGRPTEALCTALAAHPGSCIEGEGSIDDDRARRHLAALRASSNVRQWTAATLEAVRSGDASALATLRSGVARRDPVWIARIDEVFPILFDPATAGPALADLIASNTAVSKSVSARILDAMYGWDGDWEPTPDGGSAAARFRAWWTARGGRFVYSRLAGRWVPAPR